MHFVATSSKVIAPLRVADKKYKTLGKSDNPIVLDDSDEEGRSVLGREDYLVTELLAASEQHPHVKDEPPARAATELTSDIDSESTMAMRADSPAHPHSVSSGSRNAEDVGEKLATSTRVAPTKQTQDHDLPDSMDIDTPHRIADPAPSSKPTSIPSLPTFVQKMVAPSRAAASLAQSSLQSTSNPTQGTPTFRPATQPTGSPQRRIRIENALFSGPGGFFKSVHERRVSGGQPGSQPSASGHTPQAFQARTDSPAPPALEEQASDGYTSSVTTGQELPPSSAEGPRSASMDAPSHAASTTSLPLTQSTKQDVPERPASQVGILDQP